MIYYFSGTGNSKWVAKQLAERLDERVIDIENLSSTPNLVDEQLIGFVFPIYAWGICEPMESFLKQIPSYTAFSFAVCTCGADAGKAMKKLWKEYPMNSCYSLEMPSNYIIGEDLESDADILSKFKDAESKLDCMANEIIEHKDVYQVHEGHLAWMKSTCIHPLFNRFARSTKPFHVHTDLCDGCGWCATHCPCNTIQMIDGHPVWGTACFQCLRCLNGCHAEAIEYGKKTYGRKRYRAQQ